MCVCTAESLHCSSEMNTALLVGYTPKQNKKFKILGEKKKRIRIIQTHTKQLCQQRLFLNVVIYGKGNCIGDYLFVYNTVFLHISI